MQKLITKVAWTRLGIKAFEGRINEFLDKGWKIKTISMDGRLKTKCFCILTKGDEDSNGNGKCCK